MSDDKILVSAELGVPSKPLDIIYPLLGFASDDERVTSGLVSTTTASVGSPRLVSGS